MVKAQIGYVEKARRKIHKSLVSLYAKTADMYIINIWEFMDIVKAEMESARNGEGEWEKL